MATQITWPILWLPIDTRQYCCSTIRPYLSVRFDGTYHTYSKYSRLRSYRLGHSDLLERPCPGCHCSALFKNNIAHTNNSPLRMCIFFCHSRIFGFDNFSSIVPRIILLFLLSLVVVDQELHDMGGVVDRIVHESREDSLALQRCDPLDDFRRCIDAINNRHATNVVGFSVLQRVTGCVRRKSGAEPRQRILMYGVYVDSGRRRRWCWRC